MVVLSNENKMFRDAIREYARRELVPLVDEAEQSGIFPRQIFNSLGAHGFLFPRYPVEMGGGGGDKVTECLLLEEIGYVNCGFAGAVAVQCGIGTQPIYTHGTKEQQEKYLMPAIKGEKIGAFGLTEPNAGSDAAALKTRAVRDGDSYIVNGTKMFITNGTICDFVILAAYTDPSKRGTGISLLIVEKGTPGFTVSRKLDKVGIWSAETAELVFEDCRVPAANLIGLKEGGGFDILEDTLTSGRLTFAARCIGTAQAAYDLTVQYAKDRVQFGKSIASFQATKFKLADMAMNLDVMRTYVYSVAELFNTNPDMKKQAAMAKLFSSETAQKILTDCMQLHGGYGYMMEYAIQRHWRDSRIFTITEGTSEIQRLVIAREEGF